MDNPSRLIYDIETGHPDRTVEDRVGHVDAEYLDQLLDTTYGEYFGDHVLDRAVGPEGS